MCENKKGKKFREGKIDANVIWINSAHVTLYTWIYNATT